eukprot:4550192-Pyramimonas_sp.AAC.1
MCPTCALRAGYYWEGSRDYSYTVGLCPVGRFGRLTRGGVPRRYDGVPRAYTGGCGRIGRRRARGLGSRAGWSRRARPST